MSHSPPCLSQSSSYVCMTQPQTHASSKERQEAAARRLLIPNLPPFYHSCQDPRFIRSLKHALSGQDMPIVSSLKNWKPCATSEETIAAAKKFRESELVAVQALLGLSLAPEDVPNLDAIEAERTALEDAEAESQKQLARNRNIHDLQIHVQADNALQRQLDETGLPTERSDLAYSWSSTYTHAGTPKPPKLFGAPLPVSPTSIESHTPTVPLDIIQGARCLMLLHERSKEAPATSVPLRSSPTPPPIDRQRGVKRTQQPARRFSSMIEAASAGALIPATPRARQRLPSQTNSSPASTSSANSSASRKRQRTAMNATANHIAPQLPDDFVSSDAWQSAPPLANLPPRARFSNGTAFVMLTDPSTTTGVCSLNKYLTISSEPSFDMLTPDEVILCMYMRVRPDVYLGVRAALFANFHRICSFDVQGKTLNKALWSKSKAQQVKVIDVNKLSFLHKYYDSLGLWDQRWL